MIRAVRYIQERHPEWFDKDHSMWVPFRDQARRAKESNMSKKINAGDTLTVGDLTDDYLGAVIEVETLVNITHRFTLGGFNYDWHSQKELWTSKVRVGSFYPNAPVTIITPPPVVQPDKPTILGQCIRIEGDDDGRIGLVIEPDHGFPVLWQASSGTWARCTWNDVLDCAGGRQIIVSDPPRWPDETPEVPERIEADEWPGNDEHLREWEWVDSDGDPWSWHTEPGALGDTGWSWSLYGPRYSKPRYGPWTRGERVE